MNPKIYEQMREVEDRHWWFAGRRNIVRDIIAFMRLSRHAEILDAGCGTGGNLTMLSEFGSVTGVEYDPRALELARGRGFGCIHPGSLPDGLPEFGRAFDLIVLLDVLEHIDDDRASLHSLAAILKPGGNLCVTVPAFPLLWSQHDIQHHHKRRYRAGRLRDLLSDAGLGVRRLSYFNTLLFPIIAAVRMVEKVFPPRDMSGELGVPGKAVNGALETLFSSERYLLRVASLPLGVSLLAVAQKC